VIVASFRIGEDLQNREGQVRRDVQCSASPPKHRAVAVSPSMRAARLVRCVKTRFGDCTATLGEVNACESTSCPQRSRSSGKGACVLRHLAAKRRQYQLREHTLRRAA